MTRPLVLELRPKTYTPKLVLLDFSSFPVFHGQVKGLHMKKEAAGPTQTAASVPPDACSRLSDQLRLKGNVRPKYFRYRTVCLRVVRSLLELRIVRAGNTRL